MVSGHHHRWASHSKYGFTGEQMDVNGLTYLRARYYDAQDGRFISRDAWNGDANRSLSPKRWMYVEGNSINYNDPTGNYYTDPTDKSICYEPLPYVCTDALRRLLCGSRAF